MSIDLISPACCPSCVAAGILALLAAVLFDRLPPGIRSAGVIISGGNVDFDFLKTL
ncbi:MAG TPA: hypothetical protein VK789_24440 [Bryobacteraceae bacterium]|nr:hypothetical protein [Bryobacteraceae bacterium]